MESHRFCVAPMMAWTDRHARYLMRLISRHARLYSEMVPMNGLLRGEPERFLKFSDAEHPVALQIGGSDPDGLARATAMAAEWGYDEVNLNVGCPSDRVSSGHFGACLMAEPNLVSDCVTAMSQAVSIPITVKCRIGIDDMDIEEPLDHFAAAVREAGCNTLIVHARKALLKGLSPAENRTVPPLNYDRVYRLKRDFPDFHIVINGGITCLEEAKTHLNFVDGIMMGRTAYDTPYVLSGVDQSLYGEDLAAPTREDIVNQYQAYCEEELAAGTALHHLVRHVLGLFKGCPGAKQWRRHLSTYASTPGSNASIFDDALNLVSDQKRAA